MPIAETIEYEKYQEINSKLNICIMFNIYNMEMNNIKLSKIFSKKLLLLTVSALLLAFYSPVLSQQRQAETVTVSGIVYDDEGLPLPGATVYVRGQIGLGVSSTSDGRFSIRTQVGTTIVFSFVGFEDVEVYVTGEMQDAEVHFSDSQQMEELVVSALGVTQRRISSVAAVTTVDISELQAPTSSVANLLGGRVAGLITMQRSGEPGQNMSEFWIRGIGTFGANDQALVLIDGLEGDLNMLDPADIESFSILKDAAATAVYGVRGQNGVVLITTKRGQSGRLSITARVNYTLSQLRRMPDYLGAYDYARLANEAREVRNEEVLYTPFELEMIRYGTDRDIYPDVNWQDEIVRQFSWRQGYYISAQGGADVARYFVSLGGSREDAAYRYEKNNPYASNAGYNTYNYRANIEMQLSQHSTVSLGSDGFLSVTNNPGRLGSTNAIWWAQATLNPLLLPLQYSTGYYPAYMNENGGLTISPVVMINQMGKSSRQQYRGNVNLAYNQDFSMLLEGLKFRLQGAYELRSNTGEERYVSPALYYHDGRDQFGRLRLVQTMQEQRAIYLIVLPTQFRKFHLEGNLNWNRIFGDHRAGALVYGYLSDEKDTENAWTSLTAIPRRYLGLSSRLSYSFQDTYMIDFNFGYTGSENFEPGKQFGFFPSIALGWVPSSYEYVKDNMPWVDMFKIRGSYGTVGNDRITEGRRFPYMTTIDERMAGAWGGTAVRTVRETYIGATNLRWERATKANLGIEGAFLRNKLSFTIDFFNDHRDGIYQPRVQIPQYAGAINETYSNVGEMRSYGTDGNISYRFDVTNALNFTIRGNYTFSKNIVLNWEEANPAYTYLERTGYPHNPLRGLQSMGLFRDDLDVATSPSQFGVIVMPGDIKYRDVNGDGVINSDDEVPLSYGNQVPLLMYGFGGEINYRNFSVGLLFRGSGKRDYFMNGMGYIPFFNRQEGNVLTMANDPKNRWIPREYAEANGIPLQYAENPDAMFPRLQYGDNANNRRNSDFWKGDARYLRFQELTFDYRVTSDFLRRMSIQSMNIQFVCNNLYVWDKVKIFDPEQAHDGGRVYPIPTTYAIQLYINL